MPELIHIADICKDFGWTYDEYMDQPSDFLDAITAKYKVEAVIEKRQNAEFESKIAAAKIRGKH